MKCSDFKDLLDALVDAELDPATREAAEAHSDACPDCARLRAVTLRIKVIVREKAERPLARASMRSGLEERRARQAGSDPPPALGERRAPTVRYLSARNLTLAAAILIVSTLAFFFLPLGTAPKLQHYVAAEGVRDAFLRSHGGAGQETARPRDVSELHRVVRAELGVDFDEIDVPNSDFLGWHRDSVAGHRAVRMDFRLVAAPEAAPAGATIISVFLLPMKDTAFSPSYLEALEKGHYCQACIQYENEGTIYCIRRNDLFVAAVSDGVEQGLAQVVHVR